MSYRPRTAAEGKKLRTDGVAAALTIVRWRLAPVRSFVLTPAERPTPVPRER